MISDVFASAVLWIFGSRLVLFVGLPVILFAHWSILVKEGPIIPHYPYVGTNWGLSIPCVSCLLKRARLGEGRDWGDGRTDAGVVGSQAGRPWDADDQDRGAAKQETDVDSCNDQCRCKADVVRTETRNRIGKEEWKNESQRGVKRGGSCDSGRESRRRSNLQPTALCTARPSGAIFFVWSETNSICCRQVGAGLGTVAGAFGGVAAAGDHFSPVLWSLDFLTQVAQQPLRPALLWQSPPWREVGWSVQRLLLLLFLPGRSLEGWLVGLQGEFILVRWGKSMYMSQQMYTLAACLANVNRALWGTFLQTIFYHSEGLDSFSLNKCPKPSGQGFRRAMSK